MRDSCVTPVALNHAGSRAGSLIGYLPPSPSATERRQWSRSRAVLAAAARAGSPRASPPPGRPEPPSPTPPRDGTGSRRSRAGSGSAAPSARPLRRDRPPDYRLHLLFRLLIGPTTWPDPIDGANDLGDAAARAEERQHLRSRVRGASRPRPRRIQTRCHGPLVPNS